jgi:DNA polymerase-3 subunit epsilon
LEHFAAAQRSTAEARLAAQVRRVTFEETAGELGALLREARAVKVEQPLQNRRLRARVSTWTLRLVPVADRPARLEVVELDALEGEAREEIYGLFRDRRVAVNALEEIARAHQLCARVLGVERGAGSGAEEGGSCFGFQLKRCRGACVGLEPPALHDTRTRLALAPQRIARWPFRGRILIVERDWRGEMDCHLLEGWRYIASVPTPDDADGVRTDAIAFDPDIYRILKRFIAAPGEARIVELD